MPLDLQPAELNLVFRTKLRTRRKALGLSQQDVADRINRRRKKHEPKVSAPYISDLENGKRVPYISTLAELADALEMQPDALLAAEIAVA